MNNFKQDINPTYMKELLDIEGEINLYCPNCEKISHYDYYDGFPEENICDSDYVLMQDGCVGVMLCCAYCGCLLKAEV